MEQIAIFFPLIFRFLLSWDREPGKLISLVEGGWFFFKFSVQLFKTRSEILFLWAEEKGKMVAIVWMCRWRVGLDEIN